MAVNQASAVSVHGAALPPTSACSSKSRDASRMSSQTVCCSAKPRCTPLISEFSGSSLARASSRRFNASVQSRLIGWVSSVNEIAADITRVRSAPELGLSSLVEEQTDAEVPAPQPSPVSPVSACMVDLGKLLKLVDARDVVELELKFQEYEIIIRKEAALPQAPPATFLEPFAVSQSPFPEYTAPSLPTPAPVDAVAPLPPPAAPQHPPMLSPMAGTFYRSSGPGDASFVKVGDTVVKGQVVCIIEAMKLMNEIEADQSGTIAEILAEDGKPVSMESPLFSIKP